MGSFPGKLEPSEFSLASSRKGVFNYKSNSFFITSTFSQRGLNEIHELCRVYTSVQALITGLTPGKRCRFMTSFQEHLLHTCRVLGTRRAPPLCWTFLGLAPAAPTPTLEWEHTL